MITAWGFFLLNKLASPLLLLFDFILYYEREGLQCCGEDGIKCKCSSKGGEWHLSAQYNWNKHDQYNKSKRRRIKFKNSGWLKQTRTLMRFQWKKVRKKQEGIKTFFNSKTAVTNIISLYFMFSKKVVWCGGRFHWVLWTRHINCWFIQKKRLSRLTYIVMLFLLKGIPKKLKFILIDLNVGWW